jgi:Kdo2-lipid IVA lauroyltransferase/acyltransferase
MKQLRYMIEAALLYLLIGVFSLLPPVTASAWGGAIGRFIGPKLAASRKALRNLERALPDKTPQDYDDIISGMWENLGRVVAEYPHLSEIAQNHTEIINGHIIDELKQTGKPIIFIAGHLANWEIPAAVSYIQKQTPLALIYRAPNNPLVDRLLDRYRSLKGQLKTIPKAASSMRDTIKNLRNGDHIGILIDQKYNEGVAAPFFGHLAMTSPAFVSLSQNYDAYILPCHCERVNGVNFRVTLYPPIPSIDPDTGEKRDELDVIKDAHTLLEEWITEHPEQWLWLHRRWDSQRLKKEETSHE